MIVGHGPLMEGVDEKLLSSHRIFWIEQAIGYIDGWYFTDEAELLNGPFHTKEEAEAELIKHGEWLNRKNPRIENCTSEGETK